MRFSRIDTEGVFKILAKQFARGAGSFLRRVEIMLHDKPLIGFGSLCQIISQVEGSFAPDRGGDLCVCARKPGGKLNSPPGLKLGVVIPKAFRIVIKRRALMPLFLR